MGCNKQPHHLLHTLFESCADTISHAKSLVRACRKWPTKWKGKKMEGASRRSQKWRYLSRLESIYFDFQVQEREWYWSCQFSQMWAWQPGTRCSRSALAAAWYSKWLKMDNSTNTDVTFRKNNLSLIKCKNGFCKSSLIYVFINISLFERWFTFPAQVHSSSSPQAKKKKGS